MKFSIVSFFCFFILATTNLIAQESSIAGKYLYVKTEYYGNGELEKSEVAKESGDCPFYIVYNADGTYWMEGFDDEECKELEKSDVSTFTLKDSALSMYSDGKVMDELQVARANSKELVLKSVEVKDTGFGKTTNEVLVYWDKVK